MLVKTASPTHTIKVVAGTDLALSPDGQHVIAGVVLWDISNREVVEQHTLLRELEFPYVPGLLSFREAPALLDVLRKSKQKPDLLMCDGHGLAHPRRFGIACHMGIITGWPTIGCGKSILVGEHAYLAKTRGAHQALIHRGQIVGTALRTREAVKPVYVSVGHLVDLDSATRITLQCAARFRLPEPTRAGRPTGRR